MAKSLLENFIILTVILFFMVGIINIFLNIFLRAPLGMMFTGILSVIIGAYIVGYLYANYVPKPMKKVFRQKVAGLYTAVQIILSLSLLVIFNVLDALFIIIFLVLAVVGFFMVYWFLNIGANAYLKPRKKR